jgi:5-methylcytosine-specific restriction endonuclease McrA
MPWFKISDDWLDHPKVQRAGKNGRALWVAVGNRCAKYSSDGWIEGDLLKGIAALAEVPLGPTARKLVELGLWHDAETLKRCEPCLRDIEAINAHRRTDGDPLLRLAAGDYYSHDWAAHQLSKHRTASVEARMAEDRSRSLRKDPNLCQDIQARDRGRCRYCGRRVNWKDRRGPARATYDHIDPFCFAPNGGNFLEGVVVACGPCNSDKGQRTATEWETEGGPTLKPPGWSPEDPEPPTEPSAGAPPGPDPEPDPEPGSGPSPDLIPPPGFSDSGPSSPHGHGRPDAPLGPGRVGPGSGPGSGSGPGGLGLAGAGPGWAGLVRSGLGGAGTGASPPTDVSAADAVVGADEDPATDVTEEFHHGAA